MPSYNRRHSDAHMQYIVALLEFGTASIFILDNL